MVHWMVESFWAMLENFGHQIFDSLIWRSKFSIAKIGNQMFQAMSFFEQRIMFSIIGTMM